MTKRTAEEELLEEALEHKIPKKKICPQTTTLIHEQQGKIRVQKFVADICAEDGCGWWSELDRCCGIRLLGKRS